MLLQESHSVFLKRWLVNKLKPICEADHEVLSEYVMALLRHEKPEKELMGSCRDQLEDFLQGDTSRFVEDLFDHLRTHGAFQGSYNPPPLQDIDLSIPPNNKRPLDSESYILSTEPLSSLEPKQPLSSAPIPQYTPTQSHPSFLHFPDPQPPQINPLVHSYLPTSNTQHPRNAKRPRKSGICRDYHYRGYCARGGNCQFSHDDKEPDSDPSTNLQTGYLPKSQNLDSDPTTTALPPSTSCLPLTFTSSSLNQQIPGLGGPLPLLCDLSAFSPNSRKPMVDRLNSQNPTRPHHLDRSFRSEGPSPPTSHHKKPNTTLVIDNIPQSSLSDRAVRDYFSIFGSLSSVSVDVYNAQATVSFDSPEDAQRAYSSPEAVFNNRFVKIHFKRFGPPFSNRRHQAPPLTGSNEVEIFPSHHHHHHHHNNSHHHQNNNGSSEHVSSNHSYHRSRSFEASLTQPGSSSPAPLPSDVRQLSQREHELRMKIDAQKRLLEQLSLKKAQKLANGKALPQDPSDPTAASTTATASCSPPKTTVQPDSSAASKPANPPATLPQPSLQSSDSDPSPAAPLGSPDPNLQPTNAENTTSPLAAAATGEANGYSRASTYVRGGRKPGGRNTRTTWTPHAAAAGAQSFRLDNRSCALAVKQIPTVEARRLVQSHMEQFGPVVEASPLADATADLRVQFATRAAAEKALAHGPLIPLVGQVALDWLAPALPAIPGLRPIPPASAPLDDPLNDDFCIDEEVDGCWKR